MNDDNYEFEDDFIGMAFINALGDVFGIPTDETDKLIEDHLKDKPMNTNPITLTPDQVRVVLAGRLTQIRMPLAEQPPEDQVIVTGGDSISWCLLDQTKQLPRSADDWRNVRCPWGVVGDRLYVQEDFWAINERCDHDYCRGCYMGSLLDLGEKYAEIQYCATPECLDLPEIEHNQRVERFDGDPTHGRWWLSPPEKWDGENEDEYRQNGTWMFLPSTFCTKHEAKEMPRWASRITLELSGVRVERLADMSEADALACGFKAGAYKYVRGSYTAKNEFEVFWKDQHGHRHPWSSSPWVWVLDVRRVEQGSI